MIHYYKVYGLTIACPIAFPEMREISTPVVIDAEIFFSEPPAWVLQEYQAGKYSSITKDIMWFRLNDELLIYVEYGNKVFVWQMEEDLDPVYMRSYILTGAMTFLLLQRDYVLIHGSGLVHNGNAFIISGPSTSGKSTTALNLLEYPNIQFATDDICALQVTSTSCILYPGPPFQKVCSDVKAKNSKEHYTYLPEPGGKYSRQLSEKVVETPVSVSSMFILTKTHSDKLNTRELSGVNKLHALTHNLFRGELLHIIGITPQKMLQLTTTAKSFPILEIERPDNLDTTQEIVGFIHSYIEKI